jgi:peptidoglycan/xylan/chitin deacetylase (PgdA/CDA1 family)
MFEYGSRVGFWRLHRIFPAWTADDSLCLRLALERNPRGGSNKAAEYDICCHGWRWVEHFKLNEATEREHVRRAVEASNDVGAAPLGWYCRYDRASYTSPRRGGGWFLYDSDSYADELPYYVIAEAVPIWSCLTLTNNDLKWGTANLGAEMTSLRSCEGF